MAANITGERIHPPLRLSSFPFKEFSFKVGRILSTLSSSFCWSSFLVVSSASFLFFDGRLVGDELDRSARCRTRNGEKRVLFLEIGVIRFVARMCVMEVYSLSGTV